MQSYNMVKSPYNQLRLLPTADEEDSWSDVVCRFPNQPIHLWQFLRELLLKPHNYSRCIRWLNREKGEAEGGEARP